MRYETVPVGDAHNMNDGEFENSPPKKRLDAYSTSSSHF